MQLPQKEPRGPSAREPSARLRHLLNRELSWIDFDRRVLELAADPGVPLLDRAKFCAIASSNLDEFFGVRIAELEELAAAGTARRGPDGRTPAQTLADARLAIVALQETQDRLWRDELQPALAAARIRILTPDECRPRELRSLAKRVEREMLPLLTPIAVGPGRAVPARSVAQPQHRRDRRRRGRRTLRVHQRAAGRAALPQGRLARRARRRSRTRSCTSCRPSSAAPSRMHAVFRVTRDADLWVSPDADDLLEALETELRRRRFGEVVRLEIGADAPAEIRDLLTRRLEIEPDRVYESSAPLGLAALAELAALDRPELKRDEWLPVTASPFANGGGTALLARIRRRDLLAHHPYEAYDTSVESFVAASSDPKVASLKATVYRTDNPSMTLASLIDAAEDGKQAVCLVELQGAFRRAAEHRVVARPRARRRPRRLRRSGPEGPRQALAARAARARRLAPLRARRHRQLPRRERVGLRRPQSLHGRRGHRGRRRGRLQRRYEPDAAAGLPQAARQPVVHARRPPPRDRAGDRAAGEGRPRGSASR